MRTIIIFTFVFVLSLPTSTMAREVYTDKKLSDIYVLTTDSGRALIKAKGEEKQVVVLGDKISDAWLDVVKIDPRAMTVKDEYVDTQIRLPAGGGIGF